MDRVVAWQSFVEAENGEDDHSQPPRAEPADEELVRRARPRADQAQKDLRITVRLSTA
jgi:hypothetical protein